MAPPLRGDSAAAKNVGADLVFDIGLAGSGRYNKKESVTSKMSQTLGARYRTRTCDLLHVKQMLYQLS